MDVDRLLHAATAPDIKEVLFGLRAGDNEKRLCDNGRAGAPVMVFPQGRVPLRLLAVRLRSNHERLGGSNRSG